MGGGDQMRDRERPGKRYRWWVRQVVLPLAIALFAAVVQAVLAHWMR